MPELAEVERVRRLVEKYSLNKKIKKVIAHEDDLVFANLSPNKIQSSLKNLTVKKVCRKGKIFWLEMDKAPHVSFHLGMTGRMIVKGEETTFYYKYPDKNNIIWPPRFAKLIIEFNDNTKICYTNTRRFGRIKLYFNNLPENDATIINLGMDPYNNMYSLNKFKSIIILKKCSLKSALLNQSFCAGVGNWIADEVCYQSGIYPGIYCNKLNNKQINTIWNNIQLIVQYAVKVNANYHKFPSNWLFHYRWNKSNKKQNINYNTDGLGNNIIYEKIGGRTTAIVFKLQSKCGGFRHFINSKKLGKIDNYKEKLKINQKYKDKLINHNPDLNNNDIEMSDNGSDIKLEKIKKKRKKKKKKSKFKLKKQIKLKKNIGKRNLSKNIIIPVSLLRRSARLAAKTK